MATWFKWWKNKTFLLIMGISLITMIIAFLLAYFIEWGWILAIILTCIGGVLIRKIIDRAIDNWIDKHNYDGL